MEREPTEPAEQALVRHQALILLHLFVSIPHMLPSSCGTVCLPAGDGVNAEGQVPVTQHRTTSSSPLLCMRLGRFSLLNPFVPILIPIVTSNKSGPGVQLSDRGSSSSKHRATFPHACHHFLGAARAASTHTGSEIKAGLPHELAVLCVHGGGE